MLDQTLDNETAKINVELLARGHRLTPRRLMVVEALARRTHLTVDEILAEIQKLHPSTNKSTVYRTLDLLSSLGFVNITDLGGGRLEYELSRHPHHHLICERCGTQTEVEDHFFDPLRDSLQAHYGFTPNLGHFALFGTCPKCST